jgi:hypothetical protein
VLTAEFHAPKFDLDFSVNFLRRFFAFEGYPHLASRDGYAVSLFDDSLEERHPFVSELLSHRGDVAISCDFEVTLEATCSFGWLVVPMCCYSHSIQSKRHCHSASHFALSKFRELSFLRLVGSSSPRELGESKP